MIELGRRVFLGVALVLLASVFVRQAVAAPDARDVLTLDVSHLDPAAQRALREALARQPLPTVAPAGGLTAPREAVFGAIDQATATGAISSADVAALRLSSASPPRVFFRSSLDFTSQVFAPDDAAKVEDGRSHFLSTKCAQVHTPACAQALAEAGALANVAAGFASDPAAQDCAPFAQKYQPFAHEVGIAPAAVSSAYDDHCLASMLPWKHADGAVHPDPTPAAFTQGGLAGGVQGALYAAALVEIDVGKGAAPVCGALLLSGNRVLTAKHCFDTALYRSALDPCFQTRTSACGVRIQPIAPDDPRGGPWPVCGQQAPDLEDADDVPVAQDWIVFQFCAPSPIPVPSVTFADPDASKAPDAVIVSYFWDYDRTRQAEQAGSAGGASRVPDWRQGLRWPRPGLCRALSTAGHCMRMLCETVEGYSGAPIFAASPANRSQLVVFGLNSRPDDGSEPDCGGADQLSTLATSMTGRTP